MRFDLLEDASNVVRFPIERRAKPSVELLYDVAPNFLEVSLLAENFGVELPQDVRNEAEAAMAEYIAKSFRGAPDAAQLAELERLLASWVISAVEACRQAHDASRKAHSARDLWVRAEKEGGYWLSQVEARAKGSMEAAAHLLIEAYNLSQEALGASRAIEMAKRGEAWRRSDPSIDMEWLCEEHCKRAKA